MESIKKFFLKYCVHICVFCQYYRIIFQAETTQKRQHKETKVTVFQKRMKSHCLALIKKSSMKSHCLKTNSQKERKINTLRNKANLLAQNNEAQLQNNLRFG